MTGQKQTPPRWHEIYPQGTPQGNDEVKFFRALARHPQYEWRSIGAISKESGLPRGTVEAIVAKYHPMGVIVQSEKNEDSYAYWERVKTKKKKDQSLVKQDQDQRVKKAKKDAADASP